MKINALRAKEVVSVTLRITETKPVNVAEFRCPGCGKPRVYLGTCTACGEETEFEA